MKLGNTLAQMHIGQKATVAKTISEHDVYAFAGLTGDFNPIHVNALYAANTRFQGRMAHGLLTASLISNVLGNLLPGHGAIYRKQDCQFLLPVFIGDTIEAAVQVQNLDVTNNLVVMKTWCCNQHQQMVLTGMAWMIPVTAREQELARAL